MLTEIFVYFIAAICEILGCFMFWEYFKNAKPAWFLAVGVLSIVAFAYTLTRIDSAFAGRAYAAYGGIYIIASLLWLFAIERQNFNKFDLIGASLALCGACVIILGNLKEIK